MKNKTIYKRKFNEEKLEEANSLVKTILSHLEKTDLIPDDNPYDFGYDLGNLVAYAIQFSRFKNQSKDIKKGVIEGLKN